MKFKVGDRVYCSYKKKYGIVSIVSSRNIIDIVHIVVAFDNGPELYSEDGRYFGFGDITLKIPIQYKIKKLLTI